MADKSANKPKKGAHLIKKQAPKPEKPAQAVRTEVKQPKKKRRVPIGVKIAVGVVIAAAAGAVGYVYCYPNVFPGVTVGPITVGGMNRDDAANTIEDQSAPLYEGKKMCIRDSLRPVAQAPCSCGYIGRYGADDHSRTWRRAYLRDRAALGSGAGQ